MEYANNIECIRLLLQVLTDKLILREDCPLIDNCLACSTDLISDKEVEVVNEEVVIIVFTKFGAPLNVSVLEGLEFEDVR